MSSRAWSATTRPASRNARPAGGATSPSTESPPPDPTTPSASRPRCISAASSSARAAAGRRRKPSKRRRGKPWRVSRHGRPDPPPMPELPEVEVIRRDLETEIVGARIRSVQVRHTKNAMRVIRRHRTRRELEEPLTGATVTSVDRRGKYLIVRLDRDQALVIHLGMSGQLLRTAAKAGYENHTHVVFDIGPGDQLRYVDPRSFGELFVSTLADGGEVPELRLLGLDPLEHQLSWPHFHRLLSERRMKLKSLLMDQRMIAGIGTIYS